MCYIHRKQLRLQQAFQTVTAERQVMEAFRWRVPSCQASNRKGPTTKGSIPGAGHLSQQVTSHSGQLSLAIPL